MNTENMDNSDDSLPGTNISTKNCLSGVGSLSIIYGIYVKESDFH